jgi:hypothetical protein
VHEPLHVLCEVEGQEAGKGRLLCVDLGDLWVGVVVGKGGGRWA